MIASEGKLSREKIFKEFCEIVGYHQAHLTAYGLCDEQRGEEWIPY